MVAKMAKLLEKSKINQKIFSKEKDNKVFYQRTHGEIKKKPYFCKSCPCSSTDRIEVS
jgi:hypothetical protein